MLIHKSSCCDASRVFCKNRNPKACKVINYQIVSVYRREQRSCLLFETTTKYVFILNTQSVQTWNLMITIITRRLPCFSEYHEVCSKCVFKRNLWRRTPGLLHNFSWTVLKKQFVLISSMKCCSSSCERQDSLHGESYERLMFCHETFNMKLRRGTF